MRLPTASLRLSKPWDTLAEDAAGLVDGLLPAAAATATGTTVETRAWFGYRHPSARPTTDASAASPSTSPPAYAQRLFDARERGAGDHELRSIIAEGFKDISFQDGGVRALGLNDIDYLDLDF